MVTLVDVVAEEQVVVRLNVTTICRHPPQLKEAHQLDVLTVEIAKDLDWRSDILDHRRLSCQHLRALISKVGYMLTLARELSVRLYVLAFLGLQQRLEEHLAKCLVRVLVNFSAQLLLVWVQLLRLLSKFIDRDLTHDQREIFGLRVLHVALVLRCLSRNMRLICKLESAIHVVE